MPVPRTWLPGDLANPTLLNSNIKDLVTYQKGTNTTGKPLGQFMNSADQSIANNTWTDLTWNTNAKAPSEGTAFHSILSATATVTIQTAGLYDVRAQLMWTANVTGRRGVRITKNGSTIVHHAINSSGTPPDGFTWTGNNFETGMEISMLTTLAPADTLKVQVWQNSGGALSVVCNVFDTHTMFCVRWVASS